MTNSSTQRTNKFFRSGSDISILQSVERSVPTVNNVDRQRPGKFRDLYFSYISRKQRNG
jgi:hypothetical protein